MDNFLDFKNSNFIVGASALFFLGMLIIIIIEWEKRQKEKERILADYVIQNSLLISMLLHLNRKYPSVEIQDVYYFTKNCLSRQEFNRNSPQVFLSKVIFENKSLIEKLEDGVASNRQAAPNYAAEYIAIKRCKTVDASFSDDYKKMEMKLYHDLRKKPFPVTYSFDLTVRYTTPKTYKTSYEHRVFTREEILQAQRISNEEEIKRDKYKAQVEREREIGSQLRYAVLKRDGFRCTICGATQADGAKLHVDHIKPVSKGGKSEMSNLRTLCELCNLGKSDRYDEGGLN